MVKLLRLSYLFTLRKRVMTCRVTLFWQKVLILLSVTRCRVVFRVGPARALFRRGGPLRGKMVTGG